MLQQLHLPVNSIISNIRKYHLKLFNPFNIANNNINSNSKLKRKLDWFLWCKNEIQVLAQIFLKTPTLHAVTAEVIELSNRKNLKKTLFVSSQWAIMKHGRWNKSSQKWKSFKKLHRFKQELKITFFKNFLR